MPYALYQNGYAIYGVGDTPADARRDAMEWVENPPDALKAELLEFPQEEIDGNLYIRYCTLTVMEEVLRKSGGIPYIINKNGVLQTPKEEDD
jgi:hypothetical protein